MVLQEPAATNFFHCQPSLTSIRMISCFSTSRHTPENMVRVFPALQELHFQQTDSAPLPQNLSSLDIPGLVALVSAPALTVMNLEAAQGLNFEMQVAMNDSAGAQQASRPCCYVGIPSESCPPHIACFASLSWQGVLQSGVVQRRSRGAMRQPRMKILPHRPMFHEKVVKAAFAAGWIAKVTSLCVTPFV